MQPTPVGPSSLQLVRNFAYLSGAEIASKVLTFAAVAYVARIAGPVGYGYVEYAAAVLMCAGMVVDQGFGPYGSRELAKAPNSTPRLVTEVVTARAMLALATYLLVVLPVALSARSPVITQMLLLYGASLIGMPLLLQWVFQGHDRMGVAAATQVVRQATYALVVFVLVRTAADIWSVALAELAGVAAAAAYGVWMVRPLLTPVSRLRPGLSRRLFREGVPIGLSQLFWMVKMFGATLIVGVVALPADVGFFAGAQRILVALHAFVLLYYVNLLPSLARAWHTEAAAFRALTLRSLKNVVWLGTLFGIGWLLLAPHAMSFIYGPEFAAGTTTLQWLAGMWVVASISGHYRFGLIAAGHQQAEMVTSIVGAAVTMLLVPIGYAWLGLAGTGVALFTAEVAIWLSAWYWARRKLALRGHARVLVRPVLAGALALSLAWLLSAQAEVGVGLAGALFAALALAFEPELRREGLALWLWGRRLLVGPDSPRAHEVA